MSSSSLRLAGIMTGDIYRDPAARIKYGRLFDALARRFSLVDVYDASLKGVAKLLNAVQVFHPNPTEWKKRFWVNVPAYRARSYRAANYLETMIGKVDVAFQISVIFDVNIGAAIMPSIIYTDYTVILSAKQPEAGRAPLSATQLKEWVALEKLAYQNASHIFTRAGFVRDSIIEDYDILPERVTAVGGGINFEHLPDAVSHPEDEPPIVLFIGRDFYRKGGDILLDAFARTRQKYPQASLLFLTRDPIPGGFSLDGVEIISAKWDREKINECFRRANIFVLPSRLETWGDVLLEAMTFGLACIGMDVAPMTEILENEKTGLLVQANSLDAVTDGLIRLFGNGSLRFQLGQAARKKALKFYTWDSVVERMVPVIQCVGDSSIGEKSL